MPTEIPHSTLPNGPLLGVDFGTVRVGLSLCDRDQKMAFPLEIYERKNQAKDMAYYQALAQSERITGIVVGLPMHASGDEGAKAKQARDYGKWLADVTGLPVVYFDERYSSVEAWNTLKEGGLKASQRKKQLDKVAAQVILQGYLETRTGY